MVNYFILDPYHNYYANNILVNSLRSELISLNCDVMKGLVGDYKLIADFLELRFHRNLNELFFYHFNIDFRLIGTKLVFEDFYFLPNYIFFIQRYGEYVNSKINDLLKLFNVQLEYERKNMLIYDVFINTCNFAIPEKRDNWETIKMMLNMPDHFHFFVHTFSREVTKDVGHLYYDHHKDILNKLIK